MKLKLSIYTLLLSFCIVGTLSAQQTQSTFNNYGTPNIQSPNATDLGKYGDIPVSLYTGRANISIPLYTLSVRGVQMPISLDYDTSGLMVNSLPGWTGHNWALNVGGVITRRMQGMPDERMNVPNEFERGYFQTHSYVNKMIEGTWTMNSDVGYDIAPDEFTFNVMGLSGRFFLGGDGQWKVFSDANVEVLFDLWNITDANNVNLIYPFIDHYPDQSTKQPKCIKGFKLRDENGIVYEFGGDNNSIDFSLGFGNLSNSADFTKNVYPWLANCWYLTKVSDRYGNVLYTLEYERGAYVAHLFNSIEITSAVEDNGEHQIHISNCFLDVNNQMFPYSGDLISPVYLKRLSAANGISIRFNSNYQPYSLDSLYRDGLFIDRMERKLKNGLLNTNIPQDTVVTGSRYFGTGGPAFPYYYLQAYDSLHIYQYNSGLGATERYLNPLRQSRIKQLNNIEIVAGETYLRYELNYNFENRMHLTDLKVKDLSRSEHEEYSYSFIYDNYEKVPADYLTRCSDHWGYCMRNSYQIGEDYFYQTTSTGNTPNIPGVTTLIETGAHSSPFVGEIGITPELPNGGEQKSEIDFINNRSSDSVASHYGALKEIIYPTGGKTKITYENNDFSKYLSDDRQTMTDTIQIITSVVDTPLPSNGIIPPPEELEYDTTYVVPLCGGLRVKSIEEYDGQTLLHRKTFNYTDPHTGKSSGQLFLRPRYSWNWNLVNNGNEVFVYVCTRRNTSLLPLSNTFGPHVGYSYVDVVEENGHTLYHYQNISDCKDEPADHYFRSDESTSPYDRYSERGYGRGKLLDVHTYDQDDNLIKSSILKYDTLNLRKYFVYTSNFLNGCYVRMNNKVGGGLPLYGSHYKLYYPKYNVAIQTDSIKQGNHWEVTSKQYEYLKDTATVVQPYQHIADYCKVLSHKTVMGKDTTTTKYYYPFKENSIPRQLIRNYYDLTQTQDSLLRNGTLTYAEKCLYDELDDHIVLQSVLNQKSDANDTIVKINEYTDSYAVKRFTKQGENPVQVYWNASETLPVAMIQGSSDLLNSLNATNWQQIRNNRNLKVTSLTYDSLGNITSITSPNGRTEHFLYNLGNRLSEKKNTYLQLLEKYIYHYDTGGE